MCLLSITNLGENTKNRKSFKHKGLRLYFLNTYGFKVETGDFQRWINRDKLFIDVAGEKMDFWSWHLYDFPAIGGKVDLRSGSNLEATFDMHDQYSMLKLGHTKQYVISEYGAQTHDYNNKPWTPYRDWLFLRAQNSMMMSFMERPQDIAIAIPFTIVKAEWGFNYDKNLPYGARLMRKTNEPDSYTGQWVYTERVKFYQLWKNVNGVRVDSYASDQDIQVDAYIDGNKGYVILNNLEFADKKINLNVFDTYGVKVNAIEQRHLKLSGDTPVLEETNIDVNTTQVDLGAGATMILEYEFETAIAIDETSNEVKYFADSYLKPIEANKEITFNINNITKSATYGEAVLRVSIGRDHGSVIIPKVELNGVELEVPEDYRGYDQADKGRFFGTIEIPVSYGLVNSSNEVSVSYPDSGGHVSSVTMQVFNFSNNIREVDPFKLPANNYQIQAVGTTCPGEQNGKIKIQTLVGLNYKATISGTGFHQASNFTNQLEVDNLGAGAYQVSLAPNDFPESSKSYVVNINDATPVSFNSKVDEKNKLLTLTMEGAEVYTILLNGKETQSLTGEVELDLVHGLNSIEVSTNKECLGTYLEKIYIEEYAIGNLKNGTELNVQIAANKVPASLTFFNVVGKELKQISLLSSSTSLSLTDIGSGVYFLILDYNNEVFGKTKLLLP